MSRGRVPRRRVVATGAIVGASTAGRRGEECDAEARCVWEWKRERVELGLGNDSPGQGGCATTGRDPVVTWLHKNIFH